MKKILILLLLLICLFGCSKKQQAPTVDVEETLYLTFDENKLIQYVGECLNYDVIKDTNGIVPPSNMMCEPLEEAGEVPISITITSKTDDSVTETFHATVTVIPNPGEGGGGSTSAISGEQYYQCNNWSNKEDRFYVGDAEDHEDMHSSLKIMINDENKIYLLPDTSTNPAYWWESDFVMEEPTIYRILDLAQYKRGSYVPLDSGYPGYFVLQNNKLYYIGGEMVHDLSENLACSLITD